MNCTSSGLIAIGTIAGAATMNPIVLGVISGVWFNHENRDGNEEPEKQN